MKPDIVVLTRFKNFWYSFHFEFAGHSNGLALLYFTCCPKTSMFLCQKYQHLLIIKIIASILRCDVWYGTNLTTRKIPHRPPLPPKKHLRPLLIWWWWCKGQLLSEKLQVCWYVSNSFCPPLYFEHCFRGWLKINLKVYDAIHCLNENLIAYFVWYYEKEKRYDI